MEDNIFNSQGFNLSSEDIQLLTEASVQAYQDTSSLPGYTAITPELPNLSSDLIEGNSYKKPGNITIEITDKLGRIIRTALIYGDANATVYRSNNESEESSEESETLILAFRGTEIEGFEDFDLGDPFYWTRLPEFYELHTELFESLDSYISQNNVSKVLVTGHSLGGAMTEYFMEEKLAENDLSVDYQAVAIASPTASRVVEDKYNESVLNIGYQNDPVYSVRLDKFVNTANATNNTYIELDSKAPKILLAEPHSPKNYLYTTQRIIDSKYYDEMSRDSLVVIDRTDSEVDTSKYSRSDLEKTAFILGEDEGEDDLLVDPSQSNNGNDTLTGTLGKDIIEGLSGNDVLTGDNYYVGAGSAAVDFEPTKDTLDGGDGNDFLEGGSGNDVLDGGDGEDTAIFNSNFEDYKYSIDDSTGIITFADKREQPFNGSDTLENIEFAQFSDRLVPLPLEDGPKDTEEADIFDLDGERQGVASLTLPTYTYDGNADYTFTLSSAEDSIIYNFAFIVDRSGSMGFNDDDTPNNNLINAKAAYTSLINFLVEEEIPSQFAVIPFNDSATIAGSLSASQAISRINGLSASGDTNFTIPLEIASAYFDDDNQNVTNIAYFLSDGRVNEDEGGFSISARQLQSEADVRAFGIGNADKDQLDIVDSGNAVLLADSSDLESEFTTTSGFNRDDIERVDIILDTNTDDNVEGNVIETIQPDDLLDGPLGLQFSDSLEGLDVAVDAQNEVSAEVFFNDGRNTTVDFIVTAGQGIGSPTEGDDDIRMGATEREIDALGGNDRVLGNRLANTIRGGSGDDEIIGSDGDDIIIPGEGDDLIDGGEGIDTVVYSGTQEEEGGIRQIGEIIEVGGNTDTLINVEFVQFADGRVDTSDLSVVPIIGVSDTTVTEGNDGITTATVSFNLSTPATEEIRFTYETIDDLAVAGLDYRATTGEIAIASGETTAALEVEIIGDTDIESDETFGLVLSELSGATFEDNETETTVFVEIEDDDETPTEPPSQTLEDVIDLSNSDNQSVTFTVSRSAAFENTVDFYEINADGSLENSDGSTIALGEAGYQEAAIAQRIGLDLTSPNGQSTEYSDNDFSQLADEDTSNDPNVFFPYAEANIDNFDHIRSQGNLTFEFEDLLNGGTNPDFDDITVEVSGLDLETGIGEMPTESVFGTPNDDVIEVMGGSQQINALGGNDTIDASAGNGGNLIDAGSGDDTLILGTSDFVVGGEGDDSFFASRSGSNVITGEAGNDQFWIVDTVIPESINIITDFTGSEDVIGIAALGIGYSDLSITDSSGDALISANDSELAILQNVDATTLTESDFAFA